MYVVLLRGRAWEDFCHTRDCHETVTLRVDQKVVLNIFRADCKFGLID